MRTQDFHRLTRVAQDRFVDAVHRRTVPKPIISRPRLAPVPWPWLIASGVSFVGFCVAVGWGYGDLHSDVALAPRWLVAVYGALLALSTYTGLQAIARILQARNVPFPYGTYAFPAAVIEARTTLFRVYPLSELTAVEVAGTRNVVLTFQAGTRLEFRARDAAAAEKARQRLLEARAQATQPELDHEAMAQLDPLLEPRLSNPLAPLSPYAPAIPAWRKYTPLAALFVAGALALLTGHVRNTLSERRLFAVAVETNTPDAYRAYMARGGKRADVPELRLPTAELEQLKANGSLVELEQYAKDHPDSKIKPAIDGLLRLWLLVALDDAKKKETFEALDAFEKSYPSQSLVHSEVQAARKALMTRVSRHYADNYAADNPELVPFMDAMLRHLAVSGPTVEVRFQRIRPDSVARADDTVKKDKYYIASMLPSQYFDDDSSRQREERIFAHLDEHFRRAFNPDALRLVHGQPLTTSDELPENPAVPTLFITHSTNMGHGIRNQKPNGTFVGVGFVFKASFVIPGRARTLTTKYSTWRPPDLLKLRKGQLTVPEVYTTMAASAFENFDRRLLAWLFREP